MSKAQRLPDGSALPLTAAGKPCKRCLMLGEPCPHHRTKDGNGAGRPTDLTDAVIENVARFVRVGNYVEVACQAAGIHKARAYDWLAKGGRLLREHDYEIARVEKWAKSAPKARATPLLYARFADALQKALAEAESQDLAVITKAARDGAWQAAAWKRERMNPKRWARPRRDQDDEAPEPFEEDEEPAMSRGLLRLEDVERIAREELHDD